jgi:hypothetical protein
MNYLREIPKCMNDNTYLQTKNVFVNFKDGRKIGFQVEYCPKCNKYMSYTKMEKNIENVAMLFIRKNKIKGKMTGIEHLF